MPWGAVKAEGYFSLALDKKLRYQGGEAPPGLDIAIIRLSGAMTGLSADVNQPRVISRQEAGNMSAYLSQKGAKKVKITLEGTGAATSRITRFDEQDAQGKAIREVTWTETEEGCWTMTTITGMSPRDFGVGIHLATCKLPLVYTGKLRILESYTPKGFSGGGAYTIVPARALDPNAPADAKDVPVLLGNISACDAWFRADSFSTKVIYGQRSCRLLSAICWFFHLLLVDYEEGSLFKGGKGKRIQQKDDDRDLEDEDIFSTFVAILTMEGLAQQLTGTYHRF